MAKSTPRKGDGEPPRPKDDQSPVAFTPLLLLATILKCVLRERISDAEIETICVTYYDSITSIWDDEDEKPKKQKRGRH